MLESRFNNLVLAIYDTVLSPGRWPEVLHRVALFLGARGAVIFERQVTQSALKLGASCLSANYDATIFQAYLSQCSESELEDQILFERSSLEADRIELIDDAILADGSCHASARPNIKFLESYGLRHRAAALLNKDDPSTDRFSVQYSSRRGPVSEAERQKAALLLPHVAKALALGRPFLQLEQRAVVALASLDRLKIGVAIASGDGTTLFRNTEFDRICDEYDVVKVNRAGRLVINEERPQRSLASMLGSVGSHGRSGARPRKEAILVDHEDAEFALCIEVCPLSQMSEFARSPLNGHVVYCLDSKMFFDLDTTVMSSLFSLTNAEERVLSLMANGFSNKHIASIVGKSTETINSHVKSLLAKSRCANRTQLVRLATGVCASLVKG